MIKITPKLEKTRSEQSFLVELNGLELAAIAKILGKIAGNPENSCRKFTDSFYHSTQSALGIDLIKLPDPVESIIVINNLEKFKQALDNA